MSSRGIAKSRLVWTPGQLDAAVDTALREFDRYTEVWIGAAAHELAFNHPSNNLVRDAIVAVGKTAHRDRIVGHAVFKVTYDIDSSTRLGYECMSRVFDELPLNALAEYRKRRDGQLRCLVDSRAAVTEIMSNRLIIGIRQEFNYGNRK